MDAEGRKENFGRRQRFGLLFGIGFLQKKLLSENDQIKIFSGLSTQPWNFFATFDKATKTWKWNNVSNGNC